VRSIPTFILFQNGKTASRAQGYISDARLRTHLDGYAPALSIPEETGVASRPGFLGRLFAKR
jgi:thioredoxin-like negative regulator of GroEL